LLYDIETAPALAWMWSAYDANIVSIEQDWYMLSFAYRWLGSDETHFVSLPDDPTWVGDSPDDKYVVERLALAFDKADILVAHNGDRFDVRKTNARILWHGMDPPSPYQTVDTTKVARRYFANYMNSLKDLGRLYELGKKMPNEGFELWRKCMAGDPEAWAVMEAYNRQDIEVLEKLYLKLRPWIENHPNQALISHNNTACPKCGSTQGFVKRGVKRTRVSAFQTLQCVSCRGYSRERLSDKSVEKPELV
jgi:DNA polymerase III epsilon subunit-like protein